MIVRLAAAALLLVALLTWLLLRGTNPSDRLYFEALNRLDAIALSESLLQRDVLNARAGFLRNYDPLVRHVADMRNAIDGLESAEADLDRGELEAMKQRVAAQAALVERFKTNNALLQNSMAYFDFLSERISSPDADPRLAVAVGGLANAVNGLARGADASATASILKRLDAVERRGAPAGFASELASFAMHGRNLVAVVPEVDDLMRRLPTESTASNRGAIESAIQTFRASRSQKAAWYRLALYLVALALLGLLIHLGLRLRANAIAMRRRAAFERVIGDGSNRFLGSQPEDTETRLVEALRTFGEAVGADRAYVLRKCEAAGVSLWHRPDAPPPAGWPDRMAAHLADIDRLADDALHAERDDPRLPERLRDGLRAANASHWSFAKLRREEESIGVLCFERAVRWPGWFADTTSLLRMTGDVVGNALSRERNFRERAALIVELQRAQRLETIGTFTSGVAHNFNNILNVMQGHAEIALDALGEETKPAEHLRQSLQAGEHAREIVGQILDFGRGARAERQTSAIDDVVAETVEQLRSAMTEPINLSAAGGAEGALVRGAPAQLQQVLVNLIRNAAQASAPGEPVAVELKRVGVDAPRALSHGALDRGTFVRLRVTDRGAGMDGVTRARLFDPFYTTKSAGTGLGLATAQEIVRESGGAFDVDSAPGQGSRFDVWLPVLSRSDRRRRVATPTGGVLLVLGSRKEDVLQDEDILAALRYEPVGFTDPDAALAALREEPERFDLLMVNWRLHGMTGLDFAALAGAVTRRPVVLAPLAIDEVDAASVSRTGVAGVIRRPWQSNMLARSLEEVLARRSAVGATSP
ncbi:two-component system VirA-like sensor kinase [Aureimonas leprariae]|uniref:two-component system VirA-like sensor kinase n=1 Tax=Plantimonas leprariae TaxID=2615207 RepID=UPI001386A724|nr:two-component system VirA-like sensor kinase [Aureimonas leprariae]